MKKKLLFLPFVAALALGACSEDEPAVNGGNGEANGEERYMAVSIVSTPAVGSRAAGEQYDQDGATFEDGLEAENNVSGIRLYFFNSIGDPVSVRGEVNYYDIPKNEISGSTEVHGETVEKQLDAVIIVEPGEQLPAQILAVVNPHTGTDINAGQLLNEKSMTLSGVLNLVDQYNDLANDKSQFVMTNAVYMDGRKTISAKTVTPENYGKTPEEAKLKAVTIYVERNVAKVRANVASSMQSITAPDGKTNLYNVLKAKTTEGTDGKATIVEEGQMTVGEGDNKKDVYVKFLGWDITADLSYAFLSKHLKEDWVTTNPLGQMTWNSLKYQRSYWAALCDGGSKNNNEYFSFNDNTKFKKTAFNGEAWKYCNENAERNGTMGYKATKVIIKAELCDANGNPLTISEYAGARVLEPDADCGNLKGRFLLMMTTAKANSYFKVIEEVGGKTTYKEISKEDITFKPARLVDGDAIQDDDKNGRYYVYSCLTSAAEGATWYPQSCFEKVTGADGKDVFQLKADAQPATAASINDALKGLGHAKIWKSGMTYYYTPIMHFSTDGNLAGVVRNHLYNIEFTKVYGLGTPVYDPSEIIIPEKPQKDDTFLAAKINILSWRYVPNSVVLNWGD